MSDGFNSDQLARIADGVEEIVRLLKAAAPVSITAEFVSDERTVDLTPPPAEDMRPYHRRDEIAAEVEALLPISAERLAQGMGITVHALYRALRRAGRDDLWARLDREVLR